MARILLIEDEPDIRELMKMFLELEGHEIVMADNAEDGLAHAENIDPAVILMDLSLPGELDGFEATRRLRADPRFDAIPIIALTAHAMGAHRERALAAGCDAHWTKPIVDLTQFSKELARIAESGRSNSL